MPLKRRLVPRSIEIDAANGGTWSVLSCPNLDLILPVLEYLKVASGVLRILLRVAKGIKRLGNYLWTLCFYQLWLLQHRGFQVLAGMENINKPDKPDKPDKPQVSMEEVVRA
jgi:hypothetical protein